MVGSHSEMAPSGNIRKALFMTYFFWFFNKSTPNIAVEERKIWERISRMRSWRCLRDAHWFHTILTVFLWAITSNTLEDSLRKATPKPRDSREPMSFYQQQINSGYFVEIQTILRRHYSVKSTWKLSGMSAPGLMDCRSSRPVPLEVVRAPPGLRLWSSMGGSVPRQFLPWSFKPLISTLFSWYSSFCHIA